MTPTPTPTIDPEFAALLVPLTEHEEALLLDSLKREGCRDPLTAWAGENLLLDGHSRLRLCQEHGIPFAVREVELPDRRAAREWVWQNQAGRRNLRRAAAYTRGVLYRSVGKRPGARTDLAGDSRKWASEDVARLFGLDESTICRDARFARDLDLIAAELGEGFKLSVLTGKARLSRQDVRTLAGMSRSEKERYLLKLEREKEVGSAGRRKKQAAPVIEHAGLDARPDEQGDAGPIIGGGPLPDDTRPALPSPIAGSGPLPDGRGPGGRRTTATTGPVPAVAVPVVVGDPEDYGSDEDALRHRDSDAASDEDSELTEEPVDEELLGRLEELFHEANHVTRLEFLGGPLVRTALNRLHALSA